MKVFCKDCKWFSRQEGAYALCPTDFCKAPTGDTIKSYVYGDSPERVNLTPKNSNYPNKDGDCKLYKNKWSWLKFLSGGHGCP